MRPNPLAAVLLTLLVAACTTQTPPSHDPSPSPTPASVATALPTPLPPSPAPSLTPSPGPSATPSVEAPTLDLTVMTYNVMNWNPPRSWFPRNAAKELKASARVPFALAQIVAADPDIIGLQEFRPALSAGRALAAGLADYSWAVGTSRDTRPREAVAVPVLYRTSRFDAVGSGRERISRRGTGGAYMDRYLVWAELRDKRTGRHLFVFNYHAHPRQQSRYARVRAAAIARVREVIERVDPGLATPAVVLGDFNARSNEIREVFSAHLSTFADAGIVDAAVIAEVDTSDVPGADSHNRLSAPVAGRDVGKVVRRNGRHIDYIWVPIGTRVRSWATLSGPGITWRTVRGELVPVWTGVVASDHSPVVAALSFGSPVRDGASVATPAQPGR